jgi:Gas vesicle synthesis protein GvpL/GvpF
VGARALGARALGARSAVAESGATCGDTPWYVVGIVRPASLSLEGVPTLLPDRALETVASDGLVAVVCTVPEGLLDDEAAQDIDHIGQLARAHDRALRALAKRTTVVPARLGSLYPSRQAVAAMLDSHHMELSAALDELRGRSEWGLKVYSVPTGAASEPGDDAVQSGTAYLRRKQAERRQRSADQDAAVRAVAELHHVVAGEAHAAVTRPPQHPDVSGVRAPMLLNAAYLVDVTHQEAFTTVVRDRADLHREAGLRVQLTGPWPPYSFAGSGEGP